jgi:hypothetical protein
LTLRCAVAVPVLFCLVQASVHAETRPLELKWGELAPTIQGHQVELTLTGGTRVTGDVAAIRDDGMVLDVKKTSDAKAYPKGNASVPRGSVQLVKLKRSGAWSIERGGGRRLCSRLNPGQCGPGDRSLPRDRRSDVSWRISAWHASQPAGHHYPGSAVNGVKNGRRFPALSPDGSRPQSSLAGGQHIITSPSRYQPRSRIRS